MQSHLKESWADWICTNIVGKPSQPPSEAAGMGPSRFTEQAMWGPRISQLLKGLMHPSALPAGLPSERNMFLGGCSEECHYQCQPGVTLAQMQKIGFQ